MAFLSPQLVGCGNPEAALLVLVQSCQRGEGSAALVRAGWGVGLDPTGGERFALQAGPCSQAWTECLLCLSSEHILQWFVSSGCVDRWHSGASIR